MTKTIPIPSGINAMKDGRRLRDAKQATMLTLLGNPRADLTAECQSVANPALKAMMVTASVGPFRVTGLRIAVESLSAVMADIRLQQPDIHDALSSAGMLCVRHVRKVPGAISNHSWGTAIDLKIGGELDTWADGTVQVGLTKIAPIFAEHKWFWGAAFSREDGMHFECSDGLIREWAAEGRFGAASPGKPPEARLLSLGDRGEEVKSLQETLNAAGASLLVDQIFGRETQSAVMQFQAMNGLTVDGVVGRDTWTELLKVRKAKGLPIAEEVEIAASATRRVATPR